MQNKLHEIINRINHAQFFGEEISKEEREKMARRITERQGKEGAYADMFAPTVFEMKYGIKLFTGETIGPSASLRHVSGEEACRALQLLKPQSKRAKEALKRADSGMKTRLSSIKGPRKGFFCCGKCDPALWRNLTSGGLKGEERWLEFGMKALKMHRAGDGTYHRFPTYFTSLALLEIDLPAARNEMRYLAPRFEKLLKHSHRDDEISMRRRTVVERLLSLI